MSISNNTSSEGIGFTGVLTIVFVVLKLTHTIDWSWWWVLAPIWIPLGIFLIGLIIFIIIQVTAAVYARRKLKKMFKDNDRN
ncbi:hypothetical protein ACTS94_05090 [Empedobacter falsenii]